jgi:hypothetical protein
MAAFRARRVLTATSVRFSTLSNDTPSTASAAPAGITTAGTRECADHHGQQQGCIGDDPS